MENFLDFQLKFMEVFLIAILTKILVLYELYLLIMYLMLNEIDFVDELNFVGKNECLYDVKDLFELLGVH